MNWEIWTVQALSLEIVSYRCVNVDNTPDSPAQHQSQLFLVSDLRDHEINLKAYILTRKHARESGHWHWDFFAGAIRRLPNLNSALINAMNKFEITLMAPRWDEA